MTKNYGRILVAITLAVLLGASTVHAAEISSNMRNFLMTCAYGTGAGAAVGVASLAFSEDPSNQLNRVARGASLGLYVGIGIGIYQLYHQPDTSSDQVGLIILPQFSNNAFDGGTAIYRFASF